MNIGILDFLILVGVVQGFIFAITILFSRFFKSNANIYLGISLIIGVIINIKYCALKYGWYDEYPYYRIIEDIEFVLLFPVFLYFYYLKFLNPKLKLGLGHLLLVLPFIISILLNLYIGGHFYYDLYDISNKHWIPYFYNIEYYFSIIMNVAFLILEWTMLFKKKTKNNFMIDYDSKWIILFYGFHVLLVISWIILEVIDYFLKSDYTFILWLFLNFLFYWIGYNGIYKFRLAINRYEIRKVVEKSKESSKVTSKIKNDSPYFQKMIDLLKEDKLYKDSKLSRNDIAAKIGISVGYFSQIINAVSEKTFSDYLNHYRVEEAKRMLLMSEFNKYNILAIGLEAGFNSKSAFYLGFKKETGNTPSEYKKLYQK